MDALVASKADRSKTELERWKKQLIDFSKRNQLLFFKGKPSLTVNFKNTVLDIFQKIVFEGQALGFTAETTINFDEAELEPGMLPEDELIPEISSEKVETELFTDKDAKSLEQTLTKLKTRAQASLQEQGINILYLALGFLQWQDSKSQENAQDSCKSPIFLLPVQLHRKGLNGSFTISLIEDELRINPTLSYKLQKDYGINFQQFEEKLNSCESKEELEIIINDLKSYLFKEQSSWEIVDQSALSLFSFAKLSLYKDLEENENRIINHPVIRQISGEIIDEKELQKNWDLKYLLKAEEIDIKLNPEKSKLILDADSSQEEAILASKAGASLVIQGPPGTGKSQTIANIIAEALAKNKKILFVSEKKSALDVVVKRLDASKLNKFCLELHNSQQKKSDIINSLRSSLEEIKSLGSDDLRETFIEDIYKIKSGINKNINELHRIRQPINHSLYEIYSNLAKLNLDSEINNFDFTIPSIEKIDQEKFLQFDHLFKELTTQKKILIDHEKFIWRNASVNNLSFDLQHEIKSKFIEFKNILTKLTGYANPLSEKYFGRTTNNLKEFKWLSEACGLALNSPFPQKNWFNITVLNQVQTLTIEAKSEHEEYSFTRDKLLSRYSESFLDLNHSELLNKFTRKFTSVFRFIDLDYWQTMGQIKKLSLYNESRDLQAVISDLQEAALLDQKNHQLKKDSAELSLVLGEFYKQFDTDWHETITAINWVKKILGKFENESLPTMLMEIVSNEAKDDFDDFKKQCEDLIKAHELLKYYLQFYKNIFPRPNVDLDNIKFTDLINHLEDLIVSIAEIEDWLNFKRLQNQAQKLGLDQFLEALLQSNLKTISYENIKAIFLRKFYQDWADKIEIENPEIRNFTGKQQKLLVDKFNELDLQLLERNRNQIANSLAQEWIEYASNPSHKADLQILGHEINKKKKHKPIRVLIKEIPTLLQKLKPCWMMSPLSVSQLIESNENISFDLVIFDEASQIRTEDAICSIYRGKQLILAGDSNQLPPTNFFSYVDDDDYENASFESVLDECTVFLDSKLLNWHYRSRHEDLIKFSNYHIYDNQLITFPSSMAKSKDFGVHFEFVSEGYYEKGNRFNRHEASRVAQAIIDHYLQSPELSLGVIAFSEAQQFAIEREFSKLLRQDLKIQEKLLNFLDENKSDGLFIKNLENVQGDERDVIYFSIGYAKDKQGDLSHNFGPLNREGGHRRLNVAVTRARNLLKVFSSIHAGEIDLNRTSAQGAVLLKKYLAFAETNSVSDEETVYSRYQTPNNGIEDVIAKAIENKGFKVEKFWGSSSYRIDIAVRSKSDPSKFILAIETDGINYRSSKTTRDRERLRRAALESLGWKIHKVSSRDWVRNQQEELNKILQAIN